LVKQTSVAASEKETEVITPHSLLHRFKLYNEIVEKYRTKNITAGLDIKRANIYTPQTKLKQQERIEQFIKSTTHPKSGTWITSDYLLDQNVLSDQDVEQFGSPLPYARLNRLTRVKSPDGKEWLERMFTLYCLTRDGNISHKVFTNNDYYHMPIIHHMSVPEDQEDRDGKHIHVDIVKDDVWMEPTGKKVQLLEYSEDRVSQILKDIPANGAFTDLYNGCSLTMTKMGETHDSIIVKTLEEFLEPDFNKIWANKRSVPGASVDVKALVEELKLQSTMSSQTEAYQ
jgi:hypothetical protein